MEGLLANFRAYFNARINHCRPLSSTVSITSPGSVQCHATDLGGGNFGRQFPVGDRHARSTDVLCQDAWDEIRRWTLWPYMKSLCESMMEMYVVEDDKSY